MGPAVGQVPPALHTHPPVPLQPAAPGLPAARGAHLRQAEIAAVAGEGRAGEGAKREEKRGKIVVGRAEVVVGFLMDLGIKGMWVWRVAEGPRLGR